jgi:uncharacterized membrane protein
VSEREIHWALGSPWGHTATLAFLAVAVAALAASLWSIRHVPLRTAAALGGLRALGLACAVVVLLQPTLRVRDVRRAPSRIAVVADASLSMTVRDGKDGRSRWQRTLAALDRARPTLARWQAERPVSRFRLGGALGPADAVPPEPTLPATKIVESLEALAAPLGDDLGGVVLISDGADHGRLAARPGDEAARLAARLAAPIHTVYAGGDTLRDVAIAALHHDDLAFARTVFGLSAELRSTGYPEALADVRLRRDGAEIDSRRVPLGPGGATVRFEVTPDRVGESVFSVEVEPREGEALLDNNRKSFVVRVVRDRIRALHVCGRPSWDERFLRRLLKREPNVDLVSFFILRTPTDTQWVNPAELSLIPFPTDELFEQELGGFDVMILQNFAHGPFGLARHLPRIRDWVERGGCLAVVGGDLAFGPGGWAGTPVAEVLPLSVPPLGTQRPGEFRARLRPEAGDHPVVRLAATDEATRRLWDGLPPLEGANLLGPPIDGGTVLLDHPGERGDEDAAPLLSVREVGAGRTLLLGTDSTWRWSFLDAGAGGDGRAYDTFWRTALRWLIRDPELEPLRVEITRDVFSPGEPIALRVTARDREFRPAGGVAVMLEVARLDGPAAPPAPKPLTTDAAGEARIELPSPGPGAYRARARATIGRPVEDARAFVVEPPAAELGRPEARPDLLRRLSEASGGKALDTGDDLSGLSFSPSRRFTVEGQRTLDPFGGWPMLFAALGALGAEWALRRRWGLA